MPKTLVYPKQLQALSKLKFCYLCGIDFTSDSEINRDHVPLKSMFRTSDRKNPLILPTHMKCNESFSKSDKQIAQLIGSLHGKHPASERDYALELAYFETYGQTAVTNIDLDRAVWRWIKAFHSSLYGAPLVAYKGTLRTPLASIQIDGNTTIPQLLYPQHVRFVDTIKRNNIMENVDSVNIYNNKVKYRCVWEQYEGEWVCVFALNIYNWKKLGVESPKIPQRGCAGMYAARFMSVPDGASCVKNSDILFPNYDNLMRLHAKYKFCM